MKRIILVVLLLVFGVAMLSGCTPDKKERVVIYSSSEEYRIEYMQKRFSEQFPDYEIVMEYMPTGNHAAKLVAEGADTECDISFDMEYGYMEQLEPYYADLSEYDFSIFTDDLVSDSAKYMPGIRNGGAIIVNTKLLAQKNLPEPTCYDDLLKEEYKGLVSMPDPKSSGTGYMFLKSLVNAWGEDEAFEYFDKLSKNILQFTSSGSGPVNALEQGEAVIGLGMTAQAVTKINEGVPLKILFFEEGSPYSCYGYSIIEGKQDRKCVKDVFEFFYNTLVREDKELYYPEQIYKDITFEIKNYPTNILYADMSNNTFSEKERLLEKWGH